LTLEANEVRAQEPVQNLAPPWQLHEQFARWKRDVKKEADHDVGAQLAQHLRHQLELIVVDPHRSAGRHGLGDGLGETHVHCPVRLPPRAVEGWRANAVVVQRPNGGVRKSQVELFVLFVTNLDRLQTNSLVGVGRVLVINGPGPTNPESVAVLQYRSERRDETARTRHPAFVAGRRGMAHGQPVRNDHQIGAVGVRSQRRHG
jgi:hypothetical protein